MRMTNLCLSLPAIPPSHPQRVWNGLEYPKEKPMIFPAIDFGKTRFGSSRHLRVCEDAEEDEMVCRFSDYL